jgi:hypothetical protein
VPLPVAVLREGESLVAGVPRSKGRLHGGVGGAGDCREQAAATAAMRAKRRTVRSSWTLGFSRKDTGGGGGSCEDRS